MLVLSRHHDESIMIGDAIEVVVVDIKGDKVRLGTRAPREVQVHRREVYEAIKREQAEIENPDAQSAPNTRNKKPLCQSFADSQSGMLVLSRHRDESIMIGDDIEVVVVSIKGDKVRLGFSAPREVPIHRKEFYEAIKREQAGKKSDLPIPGSPNLSTSWPAATPP